MVLTKTRDKRPTGEREMESVKTNEDGMKRNDSPGRKSAAFGSEEESKEKREERRDDGETC